MKSITLNPIALWAAILTGSLVIGLGMQLVLAWTGPSAAAPGGNVAGPVTLSATGQTKAGNLILNTAGLGVGLAVANGNVGIGTLSPTAKLDVNGKIRSQSTLATDVGTTVVTKDYVDSRDSSVTTNVTSSLTTALGSALKFGGMYQKYLCDGTCRIANPATGSCTCPSTYTGVSVTEFNAPPNAPCGSQTFYENKGMVLYLCYKK